MPTSWAPDLAGAEGPKYLALAEAIESAAATGGLAAGERLPPVRDLAHSLGVTPGTVARAYRVATERGVLDATVGRGTFVRGAEAPATRTGPARVVDLRGSRAPDVGQERRIGAALERLLRAHNGAPPLWDYRRFGDDTAEREAGAEWLRSGGLPAVAEDVVITAGAQNALAVALAVASPDRARPVLTEPLIHSGIEQGTRMLGHEIETVAADGEGMIPEALDAACAAHRPEVVIICPNRNNPTLTTMGLARRQAIAGITARHGVSIIEDDVYGWLEADRLPSFPSLARERTWYLTSFSKCVAAGLRAGYLLCPPGLAARAVSALQGFTYNIAWLISGLAAELIRSGEAQAIRRACITATAERVEEAAEILARWRPRTDPRGSFLWLELPDPWRSSDFERACRDRDILVSPASAFAVGRRPAPHAARLALAPGRDRETFRATFRQIDAILAAGPRPEMTPS